ncbi:MAG TPA: NADH-quinone oxidoreductase subunit J [Rubrivivax sp.]|nr:NADH-quinone oxidoreductase subunit J [Rubrivivax sp.]
MSSALFYLFSFVLLFAAFRVITARSSVHAVLFLMLSFATASCIWMLLHAEFLAIALVLVYVGAVMVLFLFVVMMLDVDADAVRQGFWKYFPLAGFIGALIALEMALVLMGGFRLTEAPPPDPRALELGNSKMLGIEIYTNYLYPLQVAAVLLLVAIISAIALTLRRRKDNRRQEPSAQVKVKKADRLRLVPMRATVEVPSAAADGEKGQA